MIKLLILLLLPLSLMAMEDYGTFGVPNQGQLRHPLQIQEVNKSEALLSSEILSASLSKNEEEEEEGLLDAAAPHVIDIPLIREQEVQTDLYIIDDYLNQQMQMIEALQSSLKTWKVMAIAALPIGICLGVFIETMIINGFSNN